jgi:rhodanese-related sulfurtransferase
MKNVALLILLSNALSCLSQNGSSHSVEPARFEKEISTEKVQLLDVRTAGEFKTGHIKNALQADWNDQEQFMHRVEYVDKSRPVYVYCLSGMRSANAASWMREHGFSKVIELAGGLNAWRKAGKEVEAMELVPQMSAEQYWSFINNNKVVLVDVGASWCPPCVKMTPILDDLQKDKGLEFVLLKIDAGTQVELMKSLKVGPIPTFIVYKKGKEVWRKDGIVSRKELAELLD